MTDNEVTTREYACYGIDYADAHERFDGNMQLFARLAPKYADVTCCGDFAAAMEAGDLEAAYRHAHTLKGTAGNLSLKEVYSIACEICVSLRAGNAEKARAVIPALEAANAKALEGLAKLQLGEL